jgi:hypothetical protein
MQHLLRYKITYGIFILMLLPLLSTAQLREGNNLPDHDNKPIHFGINLGINRSHFSFTHDPLFLRQLPRLLPQPPDSILAIESINSTGLNLAWLVDFRLGNHFNLRTYPLNLTFTEKAFEYNLSDPYPLDETPVMVKKVQSISLTLPIQIKFSSDRIGNFKVYMMGGVKAEYDMAANAGARKAENLIKLNRLDYGMEAGLGFHFYYPYFVLTPELKIGWGLGNLHSRDKNLKFSNVIDKINSRTISFSLTVE